MLGRVLGRRLHHLVRFYSTSESRSAYLKQYREKNKDAIKKQQELYYHHHKQHIQHRKKIKYLQNKISDLSEKGNRKREITEKRKEYLRRYHLVHGERIRGLKRDCFLRNKKERKTRGWREKRHVLAFLEEVKLAFSVKEEEDWYRISHRQIRQLGGGGLFNNFQSLGKALKFAYPDIDWDLSKFSVRGKKSGQRWLRVVLQQLLQEDDLIFEDFLHPDLLWDESTKLRMELDIWVPKHQLALEYQGEHHYHNLHSGFGPSGTVALYTERDLKKKSRCASNGIILVSIPYWWDGTKESLASTLHQVLPDVFPKSDAPAIPSSPPNELVHESEDVGNLQRVSFLMHGNEWNGEQDPTGWFISEKLDGFRCFWDGSNLISKNGKVFPAPNEFTSALPPNVQLDGELWVDYDAFNKLLSITRKNSPELWKEVKFCVFDAPIHSGYYPERHAFASKSISECSPNIRMIPIERCEGIEHLQRNLQQITEKKGEGIMLYHPQTPYTSGRTSNILKVKAYIEEDVKFLQCNPNSYSFLCEQKNGATSIVKCSSWDYMFPPSPGTVITVKHNGLFKTSQKMKFPFLFKVRTDLNWEQL